MGANGSSVPVASGMNTCCDVVTFGWGRVPGNPHPIYAYTLDLADLAPIK
jgi:hypothetical protein